MSDNDAGWQPDPAGKHDHRYWDGSQWTENVADAGVASTDPYVAPTEPTPAFEDPTLAETAPPPPPDPTATWPAAPAPPLPYDPSGPVESNGGSKKGLLIGGGILALLVIAAIAFFAFGDDDDDADTDTVAPTTQPEDDSAGDTTTSTESDEDTDDTGDDPSAAELRDGCTDGDFAACDQLYIVSDVGSDDEAFGSTCGDRAEPQSGFCEATNGGEDPPDEDAVGGVDTEEMLADIYESSMGLSRAQAECLAGKVSEQIGDGEFDEDAAAAEVFDYLSDCDISLDDVQPG